MLVVGFGYGLGNQMFQYAFFKELEYKFPECKVTADICNYYGSKKDVFELERIFSIKLPQCTHKKAFELADYCGDSTRYSFINFFFALRTVLNGKKNTFITIEDPTVFFNEVFELNKINSYYFAGTWINENYFKDVKDIIIEAFKFPEITEERNLKYKKAIDESNSVSVHLRRGDYVTLGVTSVPEDYYEKAISELKIIKEEKSFKYFIFSDDVNYAKEKFKFLDNAVFVEGNDGRSAYRDMQLMSCCKHNIIANSTFSYWGAFLNDNKNKIVIAPRIAARSYKKAFACESWVLI